MEITLTTTDRLSSEYVWHGVGDVESSNEAASRASDRAQPADVAVHVFVVVPRRVRVRPGTRQTTWRRWRHRVMAAAATWPRWRSRHGPVRRGAAASRWRHVERFTATHLHMTNSEHCLTSNFVRKLSWSTYSNFGEVFTLSVRCSLK